MARKKLLTEGEIRQFMKLANLRPINKVRLSEMGGMDSMPGDRDMPELEDDEEDDDPMGGDLPEDPMGDDPEPMPEPEPMGMGEEPADEGRAQELVMSISQELEELAGMAGVDMEVSSDEGDAPEPAADLGGLEDDDDELPGGRDYGGMMEEVVERLYAKMSAPAPAPAKTKETDADAIVAEVAARVSKRLKTEERKEKLADQLAERIMKRLTK